MAASDGLRPSVLARFAVSFDIADGDVGLRSFAASFLLLSGPIVVVIISICGGPDCTVSWKPERADVRRTLAYGRDCILLTLLRSSSP